MPAFIQKQIALDGYPGLPRTDKLKGFPCVSHVAGWDQPIRLAIPLKELTLLRNRSTD
jgi:hypothetical protein